MEKKSEFNGFDFVRLFGDIGGLLAAMVGLSFIFGYVSHSEFLRVLGIGWYASGLGTGFYATKAILPFSFIGPSAVFVFILLRRFGNRVNARLWIWICIIGMLVCGLYGQWLVSQGFRKEGGGVVELATSMVGYAPIFVGGAFGVSVYVFRFEVRLRSLAFVMMVLSLYLGLVLVPTLGGAAYALLVRSDGGGKLPYVLIDNERWAVLHYVKGNSLLVRFNGGSRPEYKFAPIEQMLIRRDEKFRFPYSKLEVINKRN